MVSLFGGHVGVVLLCSWRMHIIITVPLLPGTCISASISTILNHAEERGRVPNLWWDKHRLVPHAKQGEAIHRFISCHRKCKPIRIRISLLDLTLFCQTFPSCVCHIFIFYVLWRWFFMYMKKIQEIVTLSKWSIDHANNCIWTYIE